MDRSTPAQPLPFRPAESSSSMASPRVGLSPPGNSFPMDIDSSQECPASSEADELEKLKYDIECLTEYIARFPQDLADRLESQLGSHSDTQSDVNGVAAIRTLQQNAKSTLQMYTNIYEERKLRLDNASAATLAKGLESVKLASGMKQPGPYTPRIIIHGGAGNILRENLTRESYEEYRAVMLNIVKTVEPLLKNAGYGSDMLPNSVNHPLKDAWTNMAPMNAVDAATYALMQLEDCPLFNCGKGAVFTVEGRNELEASMMVSSGSNRRSCAISKVDTLRNPVRFVRQMLVEEEKATLDPESISKRTPQPHVHISGATVTQYAQLWDIPTVKRNYYFTEKRWLEHKRGLQKMYPGEKVKSDEVLLAEYFAGLDDEDDNDRSRFEKRVVRGETFRSPRDPNWPVFLQPNIPRMGEVTNRRIRRAMEILGPQTENIFRPSVPSDSETASAPRPVIPSGVALAVSHTNPSGPPPPRAPAPTNSNTRTGAGAPRFGYRRAGMQAVFVPFAPRMENSGSAYSPTPRAPPHATTPTTQPSRNTTTSEPRTEYIPQGTAGVVVMDSWGTIVGATSTGGITNKLPGRIGDTPTVGAGFWAGSWNEKKGKEVEDDWEVISASSKSDDKPTLPDRAVGLSGTGNGDSFLRIAAAHRIASLAELAGMSLEDAVHRVAGSNGELQDSAGERWGSGEGEGGVIGIERLDMQGRIVADFNCGGMFRAWVDEEGEAQMMVFKEEF